MSYHRNLHDYRVFHFFLQAPAISVFVLARGWSGEVAVTALVMISDDALWSNYASARIVPRCASGVCGARAETCNRWLMCLAIFGFRFLKIRNN